MGLDRQRIEFQGPVTPGAARAIPVSLLTDSLSSGGRGLCVHETDYSRLARLVGLVIGCLGSDASARTGMDRLPPCP
jgi:hypothetical protein